MYRTPSSKFTFICNGLAQNTEVTILLRTQKPEDVWVVHEATSADLIRIHERSNPRRRRTISILDVDAVSILHKR
ncbi:hypothetical protein [Pseudomonas phage Poseidon]|jgi:hypothetical protein|uniref:Uncharacterized protein n=14 Tax=Pbunavirus PB1 TaxID=2006179 RepID=A0A0N7IRI7_9CAUD|nr:hypothetical protein PB1_gp84 [Pseudomonas phage PB1]ALJ99256.1 hypothetical protein [Pbunalikevirus phiVader]ALJ99346.1 hypothetical protein [Pbunalikevirus phiMoody]ALJ99436.1 hypothetical protein [Pbunalikevirus phiHabibi]ALJ99527.1 hypothetical protein [Pbunalikevirus phiFenriz]ALM62263.1 hypothetical protein [Pseudomonas phage Gallinipper]ALM62351.1 hypothetical protein [Pseudomonas phage Jollyroger]ALM62440.1 hypothetical protein [Pseudomonas phage Kraken]ALM62528.1 hypothetical pr